MPADENNSIGSTHLNPGRGKLLQAGLVFLACLILIAVFTFSFHQALGGNAIGADYFIYWNAGNALIHGRDPYSAETTLSTQMGILGHPALPNEDPLSFNYPLFAFLGVGPTLWMEFSWAQSVWMAMNVVVLFVFTILGFRRPPVWLLFSLPFIYIFAFGIILGNFCLPICSIFLFCYGYFLLFSGKDTIVQVIAGILLAWCTIKPQYAWAYLGFLLLLSLRRRMFPLLISFGGSFLVYMVVSFLVMPGWISAWIARLGPYATGFSYNRSLTHIASLLFPPIFTQTGGFVILGLAILGVLYQFYFWWLGKISHLQLLVWLSLITFLLLPSNQSGEQTILIIPLVLWICSSTRRSPEHWMVWFIIFASSYAGFFLTQTKVFADGVQVVFFLAYLAWMVYLEIARFRPVQPGQQPVS